MKTIIACPVKNIETSYEIPDSVTSIGDYAFVGCFNLTSVTIPNSVTSIGDYAFELCTKLTSITIPDSVTSIGGWTFRGCNNLTSITIPESVTSISEYAFFECDNLTIYGYENSYAQTFAEENDIPFVVIEKQVQTIIAADVTFTYGESGKITATTNGDGVISYAITTGADVISVDDKGNIIALKAGTATVKITASQTTSYMAAEKTITVTVNANTTTSVTIVPVTSPAESESITITTTITEESSATTATTSAPEESGTIITTTTTTTASGDTSTTTTTSFIITGIPSWVTTPAGTTTTTTTTPTDDKDEVIDGTVVDDDTDTTTPADDTIEPQIKGENDKTGWDVIADEIADAEDGDKIVVDMNGATEVLEDIFEQIQGQDIDLVIELDNGFTWTINGESVTEPMDIDLGVNEGATIPIKIINETTGEYEYITIALTHNGEFGFTAVLTVDMGDENEGYFANLYWYTNGGMEFICADKIPSKGKADLTLHTLLNTLL